jgi:hypothetical protein
VNDLLAFFDIEALHLADKSQGCIRFNGLFANVMRLVINVVFREILPRFFTTRSFTVVEDDFRHLFHLSEICNSRVKQVSHRFDGQVKNMI